MHLYQRESGGGSPGRERALSSSDKRLKSLSLNTAPIVIAQCGWTKGRKLIDGWRLNSDSISVTLDSHHNLIFPLHTKKRGEGRM